MIITIIILSITQLVSLYVIWNLNRKIDVLERYTSEFLTDLTELRGKIAEASKVMDEADIRGSFSSDDEIGSTFKLIKSCIDYLDGKKENISNE